MFGDLFAFAEVKLIRATFNVLFTTAVAVLSDAKMTRLYFRSPVVLFDSRL